MNIKNIILTVVVFFFSINNFAQTASYNLDNNLNDQTNSYNGSTTGNISFLTENGLSFLQRKLDAYATLPITLSQQFTKESFQVTFDYKTSSNTNNKIIISNTGNVDGFWDTAGFSIIETGGEVIFVIDDGQSNGNYIWKAIKSVETHTWRKFTLKVNLLNKKYTIEIDDIVTIDESLPNNFDKDAFLLAIQSTPITIGGFDDSFHPQFNDDFSLDNLLIYNEIHYDINNLKSAFNQLKESILGNISLTSTEKNNYLDIIKYNLYFANYNDIKDVLFSFTGTFENNNLPLYSDGNSHYESELSTESRALLFAQNYVFESQFVDGNAQNMKDVIFEHHKVIPGEVRAGAINITSANVDINGTYNVDVAAEFTDQSRVVRPTGYYLKPGDIVNVTVPSSVINSGISVIVGHHFRDMDPNYIGRINRFKDISVEYNITSSTISIASPFGGGIYFKIPDGTNIGQFSATIENAIKMPYFSLKEGAISTDAEWLNQVANNKAPWADFESDKFMITIPVEEIINITNPTEIMKKWDDTMDAIRIASGRPLNRPKAEYYTFDTRLVTPAYGAGYPQVIPISEMRNDDLWNPLKVLDGPRHFTLFHEMGHNHLHPTLNFGTGSPCHTIEAETVVHTLAISVNSQVYNMSIEDSFAYSRVNTGNKPFTFEEAVFDWIITTNFRQNLPMGFDNSVPMEDKDMLKYQPRGWAKYADIVKLFGWQALGDTNGAFYKAGQQQSSTACDDRGFIVGRDEYITAASNAVGKNLTPLFHFWGINPSTDTVNQLSTMTKSQEIKSLIEYYQCNVAPLTMDDYLVYHNTIMPDYDYQWPRYLEYINQFDATFAQDIQNQFEFIKQEYGLIGLPAPSNLKGVLNGTAINLSWTDNSTGETGFLIKMKGPTDINYSIIATTSSNTTSYTTNNLSINGEYQFKVTAINNDNLESNICDVETITVQKGTLSLENLEKGNYSVYPNPASDKIFINNSNSLTRLELYNILGQRIMVQNNDFESISITHLKKGVYIVKLYYDKTSKTIKLVKK